MLSDTERQLYLAVREKEEAIKAADRSAAAAMIRRQSFPAEDIEEILAALGLTGEPLPSGLCRVCFAPLPEDGRKACKRKSCRTARAGATATRAEGRPEPDEPGERP